MIALNLKNWLKKVVICFLLQLIVMMNAFASSVGDLPFDSTLNLLQQAISGPFLLSASIIMIVVTCLMLAFGEWGDGFKKIINIVMWLSIAFGAVSFIDTMFGGGAVF